MLEKFMQSSSSDSTPHKRGFHYIEVLVCIFIVGLLALIYFPYVQQSRTPSRRSVCKNNLKQMVLALHNFHDTFGHFPSGWEAFKDGANDPEGTMGRSLFVQILPFMEEGKLFEEIKAELSTSRSIEQSILKKTFTYPRLNFLRCPSSIKNNRSAAFNITSNNGLIYEKLPLSDYVGAWGSDLKNDESNGNLIKDYYQSIEKDPALLMGNGVFWLNSNVDFEDIIDGTSYTLLLGEIKNTTLAPETTSLPSTIEYAGTWPGYISGTYIPPARFLRDSSSPLNCTDNLCLGSYHPEGAVVGSCDGLVRFISDKIDSQVFQALFSRNDHLEVIEDERGYQIKK